MKDTTANLIIGTAIGLGTGLIGFAGREYQNHKQKMKLWDAYQAEAAARKQAVGDWKAEASAHAALQTEFNSTIGQLNKEIKRLENLPPEIRYEEKYFEVKVNVPVEIPVYTKPRHFSSLEELTTWVENWTYWDSGVVVLVEPDYDCDDFGIEMVTDAALDGYILGYMVDVVRQHLAVTAIIGNDYYFIEPQNKAISNYYNGMRWVVD